MKTSLAQSGDAKRHRVDISLAGTRVELLPSGAAFLPASDMLVVADLHIGKSMAFAAQGQMLPPYEAIETIRRLRACVAAVCPSRLVLLGDSFHRQSLLAQSFALVASELAILAKEVELLWVTGNHDPDPGALPGSVLPEVRLGCGLSLRHQPVQGEQPEMIGHFHPAARLPTRAGAVRRRCFVSGGHRLLLPAFGALTGGLPVSDRAIADLFPDRAARAFLLVADGLAEVPLAAVR